MHAHNQGLAIPFTKVPLFMFVKSHFSLRELKKCKSYYTIAEDLEFRKISDTTDRYEITRAGFDDNLYNAHICMNNYTQIICTCLIVFEILLRWFFQERNLTHVLLKGKISLPIVLFGPLVQFYDLLRSCLFRFPF